eukprot:SAG31_NODE_278_length_18608_cov_10.304284_14_plen_115_part_00
MLLPQGLLLATVLAGATSASLRAPVDTEAVVELGGTRYRVQALSSTLVRLEAEGPHGFENRSTFFAQNRSSFSGVPISVSLEKRLILEKRSACLAFGAASPLDSYKGRARRRRR